MVDERADRARPIRTYDTAVIYYHKFRLVHSDTEYSYTVRMADCSLMGLFDFLPGCGRGSTLLRV
jgi:hypothetical protein